ncbi:DUF6950 family protein [Paracoccus aminophilus]|uniref:DUF6950 domain-containing protein n=1 Tax=Paracoccus aminophilus JCM 7686 TaxID=1367847 RepID=S5XWV8_PARAH|nr:hypothetical protein [Paracoccus aminophilus]AGT07910.1 hypothetical protein JCM7686_0801 [Paracoccus aminophilus JCM 7686]
MACAVTPDRVMAEVERVMSRPFEWGPRDCCSAACDVFAALWGFDPMARFRGYRGARDALRLMADGGGLPKLCAQVSRETGLIEGHAPGGFGLTAIEGLPSLLICITPGTWAGKTLRGFALVRSADKGWCLAQTASDLDRPSGLCRPA